MQAQPAYTWLRGRVSNHGRPILRDAHFVRSSG